ncbi:hypothetical protein E1281_30640 [Actinomadura sp. KC345]|uniref:hypothetical protein n=1 Tax=Actinomadura sp. KC345 TaxID=2530371 RepID=UPI001051F0D4|nr:hypothetical protein [Actinomadura sp. KC345]TDC45347.1 hypothetical protein E1281_30640 [Actinomadura sp. KC345]
MTANSNDLVKFCDRLSAGAVVEREVEGSTLVLIGECATGEGWAGPAGHVRDKFHSSSVAEVETVVRNVVTGETGMIVTELEGICRLTWRGNPCARVSGPAGDRGHWWWLHRVGTLGDPVLADGTFTSLRWAGKAELQRLADRALAYVRGEVSEPEWAEDPGMHPLWVLWFRHAGHVEMSVDGLSRIELWVEYRGLSNR